MKHILCRKLYLNRQLIQSTYMLYKYEEYGDDSIVKPLFVKDEITNDCIFYKYYNKIIDIKNIFNNDLELIRDNKVIIEYQRKSNIWAKKIDYVYNREVFKTYKSSNKVELESKELITTNHCKNLNNNIFVDIIKTNNILKLNNYTIIDHYNNDIVYYEQYEDDNYHLPWWCADLRLIKGYRYITNKDIIDVNWDINKSKQCIYINHKNDTYILECEFNINPVPIMIRYYKGIKIL